MKSTTKKSGSKIVALQIALLAVLLLLVVSMVVLVLIPVSSINDQQLGRAVQQLDRAETISNVLNGAAIAVILGLIGLKVYENRGKFTVSKKSRGTSKSDTKR